MGGREGGREGKGVRGSSLEGEGEGERKGGRGDQCMIDNSTHNS